MPFVSAKPGDKLVFTYRNHRGEVEPRAVELIGVDYGSNEWYPEPQWFLRGRDMLKNAERSFAFANIVGELAEWEHRTPTVGDGSGDAAVAIAEHAFKAGYQSAADRARAFHPTRIEDDTAHKERAWSEYDPPEHIKALS